MRSVRVSAAVASAMLLAASAFAGMYYEAKTVSEGKKGAEMMNQSVKGWVSGDKAKVEFVDSNNPMAADGTYLITTDGGSLVYLVNPKDKTYMKWDMNAMLGMAGGMMKMMNMTFSNPKVEKLDEGVGQPVAGIPTKYYKFRTTYDMEMKFMGMKTKQHTVQEEEIWSAPELVEAALAIWLRKEPPSFNNEQLDALVKAEMSKVEGFPLKRITRTTSTDEKGKSEVTLTTMEVTKMQATAVPESSFAVPAGYKETSMFGGEEGEENPLANMFGGKKK